MSQVRGGDMQPRGAVSDDDSVVRRSVGRHILAALRVQSLETRDGVSSNDQEHYKTLTSEAYVRLMLAWKGIHVGGHAKV